MSMSSSLRRRKEANAWGSYSSTAKDSRSLPLQVAFCSRKSSLLDTSNSLQSNEVVAKRSPSGLSDVLKFSGASSVVGTDSEPLQLSSEVRNYIFKIFSIYFDNDVHDINLPTGDDKWSWNDKCASVVCIFDGTMPWLSAAIESKVSNKVLRLLCEFVEHALRGIGQVYFQNNPITGLFILVGLFLQSSRIATHGVIAIVTGNLAAYVIGFDTNLVKFGLFGYNAFLVGLELATMDGSGETHRGYSAASVVFTVILAALSSVVFVALGKLLVPYKVPPLTLPFNLVSLLFLLATANMTRVSIGPASEPALPDYSNDGDNNGSISPRGFFAGMVRGIGQVFLADDLACSVLVLVGIAICSRISAVAALLGSALGSGIALATGVQATAVENGIYGYNASLSVTAMVMFYLPSLPGGCIACFSGLITVIAQQATIALLQPYGLPAMTLPFCLVSLPFLLIQGTTERVIAIPLSTMTTSEDHVARVRMIADGFTFLREAISSESETERFDFGGSAKAHLQSFYSAVTLDDSNGTGSSSSSFTFLRPSFFQHKHHASVDWIHRAAKEIFVAVDPEGTRRIDVAQFQRALKMSGLTDPLGIRFAGVVFDAVLDQRDDSMDYSKFFSFVVASVILHDIRRKVQLFLDFVDTDNDGYISMQHIESALVYLGKPSIEPSDAEKLATMIEGAANGGLFKVDAFTDSILIAIVKNIVSAYKDGAVARNLTSTISSSSAAEP